ncbi:MAG: hypothetical protein QF689_07125 [Candidatus Latescibacteria bacterium]|nr:hypothetical protein [Candidatus Latescibacterota bacterium]
MNEVLRRLPKTIIFGQQNRLRDGVLMEEDERLDRFHAGHDLVRFFYGGVRQLPDYLTDALLAAGVSITLVKSDDLLVFHDCRRHQSFHTGRTRKTIYMPQLAVQEASQKGYDYWAISEVIIEESWSLLDYLLILELVRHCQQHLHEHFTLGHAFVRGTLEGLNRHRKVNENTQDNEFQTFFDHYKADLFRFDRGLLECDPYDLTDEIFDEGQERTWASNKLYDITEAFSYPTFYSVDRDIVHPAALRIAEARGQSVAPESIDHLLHDLGDAARFGPGAQIKSDELMDRLIERGEPGIRGYLSLGWDDGRYYGGGFYPTVEFKRKLQALSSGAPEGMPGSISQDFDLLLDPGELQELNRAYQRFNALPFRLKKFTVLRLVVLSGTRDQQQLIFEVENALLYTKQDDELLKGMAFLLFRDYLSMDPAQADFETHFMGNILRKLDRHSLYHTEILAQLRALLGNEDILFKENLRERVEELRHWIPDDPARQSFDPQRVRARVKQLDDLRAHDPDHPDLLALLAGAFLRLDRCERYDDMVAKVKAMGEAARPVCEEIVGQIAALDITRDTIRSSAVRLLREWDEEEHETDDGAGEPDTEQEPLLLSFHRIIGVPLIDLHDQAIHWYMRQGRKTEEDVRRGLQDTGIEIPPRNRAVLRLLFEGPHTIEGFTK